MAEKKDLFTVTDKRKFTFEGELRPDVKPEPEPPKAAEAPRPVEPPKAAAQPATPPAKEPETPPAPSADEQAEQEAEYKKSTSALDEEVKRQMGGRSLQDFEVNFERFAASLYMTALMQLGLAHEQGGQPRVDLMGARHTIDTLSMLQQKTKGNLTFAEQNFLENCLYELRVAYVEVTNALTRPPQGGEGGPGGGPIPFKK